MLRRKLLLWAIVVIASPLLFSQAPSYDEPWRPQYHFTPPQNFMNDPNGTVYYKGEYHLFYQHNPEGNVWGHMSWGHAISSDLVHWQNMPVALHEEPGKYMVYSGSAVVDWDNTSGLCKNPDPNEHSCLVAIYTAAYSKAYNERQKQHIAYSNDRGRTWTNYSGNPVADLEAPDFRDPNVFWYAPQKKWVMVAVLADRRTLVILDSADLKKWTKRSTFGPVGDTHGQWECPDLIQLPIEGSSQKKWVLIINRNPGAPAGGTGVRYFVGNFDGTKFTSEVPEAPLWADWGKDFYATNTWNDMPANDGRVLWIGWFSNWQYANVEPTILWRGGLTIPRTLALRKYADGIRLVQKPIRELQGIRDEKLVSFTGLDAEEGNKKITSSAARGEVLEIETELEPGTADEVGIRVRKGGKTETVIGYAPTTTEVFVDRSNSGEVTFSKDFPGRHGVKIEPAQNIKLRIFIDRSSVEVFASEGERVISDRIYPPPGSDGLEVFGKGQFSVSIWRLKSSWQ
jgi:fructan beta-fructosidase